MRPRFIVLITVMSILTTLLSSFPKVSARRNPISQTGDMAAAAVQQNPATVPTVVARPVRSAYQVNNPSIAVRVVGKSAVVAAAPAAVQAAAPAVAPAAPAASPALEAFAQSLVNGNTNQVVGVYVQGTLALPVLQQPNDNPNYVSTEDETVTQFAAANRFHTIGLLAHNYLAGTHFSNLKISDVVVVVYGNGDKKYYQVNKVERYQALSPTSPQSDFVDLNDGKNTRLTAGDVFSHVYTQGDQVVFQTCILNNGDPSWGRLFITAVPMRNQPTSYVSPESTLRFNRWF